MFQALREIGKPSPPESGKSVRTHLAFGIGLFDAATTTAMLAARGMDAVAASRTATSLLGRVVAGQFTPIAFDMAFNAVACDRRARAGHHQHRILPIHENARGAISLLHIHPLPDFSRRALPSRLPIHTFALPQAPHDEHARRLTSRRILQILD
ncbi:hypothetical protein [Bradyrhizobium sp. AZCC 1699]|uniref:hypothetical protein n=1 Tax=unclassified Bradyrhizobium TaxID=2631580 RepID=UPI003FA60E42